MKLESHHAGAAIAFLALLAWFVWFAPRQQPVVPPSPPAPGGGSAPGVAAPPTPAPGAPAAPTPSAPTPEVAEAGASAVQAAGETEERVETNLFSVRFTNRGGRVTSWKLKEYRDASRRPLELLIPPAGPSRVPHGPLEIDLDDPDLAATINAAPFVVERTSAGGTHHLRFRWADGRGLAAEKSFTFRDDDYIVSVRASVSDRGRSVPVRLAWGPGFEAQDGVRRGSFHYHSQLVRNLAGRVERAAAKKVGSATTPTAPGDLRWAGLEDQYFAALLLPGAPGGSRAWSVQVPVLEDPKDPSAGTEAQPLPVVAVAAAGDTRLFVGPKSLVLLRDLGLPPRQVIWFSDFGGVDYLAELLLRFLLWLRESVVANWGLVIVLATFCLRVALFPLNQYSMVKMRKAGVEMQRLKPRLDAIKAKHAKKKDADSRKKMNEEMMALYAKEGINPFSQMSGCLPILIQFPVLIAFYNVFTVAVELRGAPFGAWIRDLSLPDPYWITPLLMGGTMFYQQKLAMQKTAMDPTQARMMLFMPLIFTVTFLSLPSGLVLYWLTNNVLGIAQQWLVNRHMARLEAAPQRA